MLVELVTFERVADTKIYYDPVKIGKLSGESAYKLVVGKSEGNGNTRVPLISKRRKS